MPHARARCRGNLPKAVFSIAVVLAVHASVSWLVRQRQRHRGGRGLTPTGPPPALSLQPLHAQAPPGGEGARPARAQARKSLTGWRLPPRGSRGGGAGKDPATSCAVGSGPSGAQQDVAASGLRRAHTVVFVGDVSFARDTHNAGVHRHGSNFSE